MLDTAWMIGNQKLVDPRPKVELNMTGREKKVNEGIPNGILLGS